MMQSVSTDEEESHLNQEADIKDYHTAFIVVVLFFFLRKENRMIDLLFHSVLRLHSRTDAELRAV